MVAKLKQRRACLLVLISISLMVLISPAAYAEQCVILLHGLARTSGSLDKAARALSDAGYISANIDYESRTASIEQLAATAIPRGLEQCASRGATGINFVTHSLGGILVRQYLSTNTIADLQRVVMLAPPNQGSEVVDELKELPGFEWLNGPAGDQLGVKGDSVPRALGKVDFDLGIVAGTTSINPILSSFLPDPDDGKVSVESARVEGMCGFMTVPVSHPFIMKDDFVIEQIILYLRTGAFDSPDAEQFECSQRNG